MADAARELVFDIEWDIEATTLEQANDSADKQKTAAEEITKESKKAGKAVTSSANEMVKGNNKTADSAETAADEVASIGQEAEASEDKVDKLSDKGAKLGQVFKVGLGLAVAGLTATAAAAIDAGIKSDEYFKTIAVGTGATGEQLDGLMKSFEAVGRSTDDDLGAVAGVIADVNTRLGYEGDILEQYTGRILGLGDLTGDNFSGMAEAASNLAQQWELTGEEAVSSLDKIFVASQATGLEAVSLTSSVNQFGPVLRELGYDLDTSIALLGSWDKAGLDGSRMLTSLQRASTKLANTGVTDLGAGLQGLIEDIEGATTAEEAQILAIEAFGPAGLQMAEAIRSGAFEVEDLVGALQSADGAIDEAGAATETFTEKLARFQNNIQLSLAPIGGIILDTVGGALDTLLPMVGPIVEQIGGVFQSLTPMIGAALEQVGPLLETAFEAVNGIFSAFEGIELGGLFEGIFQGITDVLPTVIDLISGLMSVLSPVIKSVTQVAQRILPVVVNVINRVSGVIGTLMEGLEPIVSAILPPLMNLLEMGIMQFETLFDAVMPIIEAALPPLMELIGVLVNSLLPPFVDIMQLLQATILPPLVQIFDAITMAIAPIMEVITFLVQAILPPLMERISFLAEILSGVLGVALDLIANQVTTAVNVFSGLIDFITSVFTGDWEGAWTAVVGIFTSVFDGIKNAFKIPINWIIERLNSFLGGLSGLEIPIVGTVFNFEPIPLLAEGTNFFGGGAAIVGEEGPELVDLPRGSRVIPNEATERMLFNDVGSYNDYETQDTNNTQIDNSTINIDMQVNIDASNADESTIEQIRDEVRAEIPRVIQREFKKIYLKNKPVKAEQPA